MFICWFDVRQVGGNRAGGKRLKQNFRFFASGIFNVRIFVLRIFTKTFIISRKSPVGKKLYPRNIVDNVAFAKYFGTPPPGSLWAIDSNGSRWVQSDWIITTTLDSSPSHARTTLQTAKVDIPITLYLSGNCSSCLVGLDDGWLGSVFQTRSTPPDWMQSTCPTSLW